jgi:hypothetical protein
MIPPLHPLLSIVISPYKLHYPVWDGLFQSSSVELDFTDGVSVRLHLCKRSYQILCFVFTINRNIYVQDIPKFRKLHCVIYSVMSILFSSAMNVKSCIWINPLIAMVDTWHNIIVIVKVLAQKGFIGTWIAYMKCISERLPDVKCIFWCHTSSIHSSLHHKSSWHLGG